MKIWTIAAALAAGPALADLQEMPDYVVDALVSSTTAQALALSCPSLSVNPVAAVNASELLMAQLAQDGADAADPMASFLPGDDKLAQAQAAFMDKHQLQGAKADAVCAAGRLEMAQKTSIGILLLEEGS